MTRAADKIGNLGEIAAALNGERRAGNSVALANGLFDVLHVGHLRYLEGASREADVLVVAVNSDASARALKGRDRPLVSEHERAHQDPRSEPRYESAGERLVVVRRGRRQEPRRRDRRQGEQNGDRPEPE